MAKHTIVTLPGDGIGAVVLQQAIRVLDKAGFDANYFHGDIGWEFWCKEGKAELNPDLQGKGYTYSSPIVGLRQHFNLDICIRPCKSYKGNPLNFVRRGKGNTIDEPLIDVVIFRQNTECLYSGVEWTNPPAQVYQAMMTHPKFIENFGKVSVEEISISTRIFTKKATIRKPQG